MEAIPCRENLSQQAVIRNPAKAILGVKEVMPPNIRPCHV